MIRPVFRSALTAILLLLVGKSLFGAGYSTADDDLVLSRNAPPIAGFSGGYTGANDPPLRTSGRPLAGRPGIARVASGESSPTDLPSPLDPDQVFPPEGRPNQRPSMVSEIGAGSAVASDQQSRGGSAHAESTDDGSNMTSRRTTPYASNGNMPGAGGPNGQCNDTRWGLWSDNGNCNGWPKWYGDVGAIFLWRDNRSRVQPVVESISTESTIFDTHSADFDTGIGPRILLGVRCNCCSAWEMEYFSALDFDGSASVDSVGNLAAPGEFSQLLGWSGANRMSLDYNSELHNLEINYLRSWGCFSLLGGFRYVRLSEEFGLRSRSSIDDGAETLFFSDNYRIHTENNLFGAQLGARYRFCCDRFFGEFTGKAGLFGNDINEHQFLTAGGGNVVRNLTRYDGTTALVADMNISAGYQLNCTWAFRCGYNLMWIDQVALAADQVNFNLDQTAGTHVEKRGDVFLHGIDVGLEARW